MSQSFIMQGDVLKQYTGTAEIVNIPAGVVCIGYGAFRDNALLQQVILPEGIKEIGSQAFSGCTGLKKIILPDGLQKIGYSAFESCTALLKIHLPNGLFVLDRMAFRNCTVLNEIQFPDTLCTVGRDAFAGTKWLDQQPEGVVYAGQLAFFCKGTVTQVQLRPGTVQICPDGFRGQSALTDIRLSDDLQVIGDRAFQYCRKLRQLDIPAQLHSIGERAFDECSKIEVVLQGEKVSFGRRCFADTASIRLCSMNPASLPENVQMSAILAFADDVAADVKLDEAFYQQFCKYLQSRRKRLYPLAIKYWNLLQLMLRQRMIPLEDVDSILESFLLGEQTETVAALMQYKQTIQKAENNIFEDAWDDLELDWDSSEQVQACLERDWGLKKNRDGSYTLMLYRGHALDVVVPSQIGDKQITAIAPAACSPQRHGIRKETAAHRRKVCSVSIQEGIAKIGNHAFADCEALRQLTIPEGVLNIGYAAFQNCRSLTELYLPDSIEQIGSCAFAGCTALRAVQLPEHAEIADDAFADCPNIAVIQEKRSGWS